MENQNGLAKIELEDVTDITRAWGFSLVGYVAGGFPGIAAINKMRASWKAEHKFSIQKSGWIVFKFFKEEERERVLEWGEAYTIYRRPLILKHMPHLFEFGPCTYTVVPI